MSDHVRASRPTLADNPRRQVFVSWVVDVLVYIVVLNLFVEFNGGVVIDSFTISIFTAVLLKALLALIIGFEHRVKGLFDAREGAVFGVAGVVATFAILFLSKFVILEAVDIVFGDEVELGGLLNVIFLVVCLIGARMTLEAIFRRL